MIKNVLLGKYENPTIPPQKSNQKIILRFPKFSTLNKTIIGYIYLVFHLQYFPYLRTNKVVLHRFLQVCAMLVSQLDLLPSAVSMLKRSILRSISTIYHRNIVLRIENRHFSIQIASIYENISNNSLQF